MQHLFHMHNTLNTAPHYINAHTQNIVGMYSDLK